MTGFHGDWSNHDWTRGPMDIAAMAADGIQGGFHKLGDGLNYYVDPYFPEAARRMRGSSLLFWGAYFVVWGNRDIKAQADWHISLLDANAPGWRSDSKFRIMSDDEKFLYNVQPSPAQINAYHDHWLSKCPWLTYDDNYAYAPDWVYGGAQAQIRYRVVASNYGSNPVSPYRPAYPGDASRRWAVSGNHILQYGSQLIQGTQSTTDVNAVRDPGVWAALTRPALLAQPQEDEMPFLAIDSAGTVYLCTPDFKSHVITEPVVVDEIIVLHQTGARPLGNGQGNNLALATDWQDWGNVPKIIRTGWRERSFGTITHDIPTPPSA